MSKLCIVGLGMIGGSLAGGLKQAGYQGEIVALVRSAATGERGMELGLIDQFSLEASDVVRDADIVMLAVPMLSMRTQMELIKEHLKPGAIVTDAGSVKTPFIRDARAVFGDLSHVVPGHPIAGREKTGVDAADANLYHNRRVLLTPVPETSVAATAEVQQLWEQAGAEGEILSPEQHDRVLAATPKPAALKRRLGKDAASVLTEGWQARALLSQAIANPTRAADGALGLSEFGKRWRLLIS